ncbi:MAG: pantetheine-phosphate adenylyltransferase [Tenericutes bacterium]|nr:MAG: pantetheine-phosphate adenylyltransferase [Mycoplasmatota bacterium]
MKKAIYVGSFDPIHNGHMKVLKKALGLFDEIIVIIANNDFKKNQGNLDERFEQVKRKVEEEKFKNVSIYILEEKYLATWAKENNITYLVRSARNNTDFKYELDLAKLNKEINPDLETILIIPDSEDLEYSSSKFRNFKIDKNK